MKRSRDQQLGPDFSFLDEPVVKRQHFEETGSNDDPLSYDLPGTGMDFSSIFDLNAPDMSEPIRTPPKVLSKQADAVCTVEDYLLSELESTHQPKIISATIKRIPEILPTQQLETLINSAELIPPVKRKTEKEPINTKPKPDKKPKSTNKKTDKKSKSKGSSKPKPIIPLKSDTDEEGDADVICQACLDPLSYDGNSIVFCDGCDVTIHQACQGISLQIVPEGKWFCDKCENYESHSNPRCSQCGKTDGPMWFLADQNEFIHIICAAWIEPDQRKGQQPYLDQRACSLCCSQGGTLQCSQDGCLTYYHAHCASKSNIFMNNYVGGGKTSFCAAHKPA